MNINSFEQARQYVLRRLEKELSSHLTYHGLGHTRDDVVPAAQRLAELEGVNGEDLTLLLTAAWFHDLGFVEQAVHHELISARIAAEVLPGFGYTQEQVDTVRWAILATALPQSPESLIDQILTDADLDVLGREDFMERNRELRRELALSGREFTDQEWYKSQIKFLETHEYFTASARKLRNQQKAANVFELKKALAALDSGQA